MAKARPEILARLHELRFTRYLNSRMLPSPEKGFCKWCGGKATRVWCSEPCRNEAYIRMGYSERQILNRDKGVCASCGLDTIWLLEEIIKVRHSTQAMRWSEKRAVYGPWWREAEYQRLWEADHIVPVCEGGGCCGLENYQTLCLRCHKDESAHLAKRRSRKV